MTRCKFEARVVMSERIDDKFIFIEIQCANEEGHVGDHLILVPDHE